MSDERDKEVPRVEDLELNKETLQELTEPEGEAVQGGAALDEWTRWGTNYNCPPTRTCGICGTHGCANR